MQRLSFTSYSTLSNSYFAHNMKLNCNAVTDINILSIQDNDSKSQSENGTCAIWNEDAGTLLCMCRLGEGRGWMGTE